MVKSSSAQDIYAIVGNGLAIFRDKDSIIKLKDYNGAVSALTDFISLYTLGIRSRVIISADIDTTYDIDMRVGIRWDLNMTDDCQIGIANYVMDGDSNGIFVTLNGNTLTFDSAWTPMEGSEDFAGATLVHITYDVLDDTASSEIVTYFAKIVTA